jgi:hypothetical protein
MRFPGFITSATSSLAACQRHSRGLDQISRTNMRLSRGEFHWYRGVPYSGSSRHDRKPVERDLHFEASRPISVYFQEARRTGRIVT